MHHMIVTVNGTAYDVQVQLLDDDGVLRVPAVRLADQQRQAAVPPSPAPPPTPAAPANGSSQATAVTAPLAGTVVQIHVQQGDQVREGQTVITLEAMKMNTEITATCNGTVASVDCAANAAVAEGATLLTITPQG